jgi:Protein  of unknown function (DUF3018)
MTSRTFSAKSSASAKPSETVAASKPVKTAPQVKKAAVRERVRRHRESLRAQGLRPIQIWIPDIRRPGFAEEARRQSLAVARDKKHEKEVLDFIEQSMDYTGWA